MLLNIDKSLGTRGEDGGGEFAQKLAPLPPAVATLSHKRAASLGRARVTKETASSRYRRPPRGSSRAERGGGEEARAAARSSPLAPSNRR